MSLVDVQANLGGRIELVGLTVEQASLGLDDGASHAVSGVVATIDEVEVSGALAIALDTCKLVANVGEFSKQVLVHETSAWCSAHGPATKGRAVRRIGICMAVVVYRVVSATTSSGR